MRIKKKKRGDYRKQLHAVEQLLGHDVQLSERPGRTKWSIYITGCPNSQDPMSVKLQFVFWDFVFITYLLAYILYKFFSLRVKNFPFNIG